ncbi:MAG: hypothetical protein J7513_16305 [Solirubrobacteraceae bacterium]|nr:hypothetical protein [Solirubrobacteraceae bacterium]
MPPSQLLTSAVVATVLLGIGTPAASAQDATPGTPTTARAGLLGSVTKPVTTTLDGALQSVSSATGGAVTLPSTTDLTSGVVDTVDGTVQVVASTVDQVTAPVTQALSGPQAAISLPGLAQLDGAAVLDLVVGNVGTDACAPVADLAITGKDGVRVAGGVTQLLSILPGASREYALPWPSGLDAGTYAVGASVSGCGSLQALSLSVTVGGDEAQQSRSGSGGGGTGSTGGTGSGGSTGSSSSGSTSQSSDAGSSSGGGNRQTDSGSAVRNATSGGAGGPDSGTLVADHSVGNRAARTGGRARAPRPAAGGALAAGPAAPAAMLANPDRDSAKLARASGAVSSTVAGPPRNTIGETASAVARALPAVIERAAPALAVLGLIGALFLLQEGLAKRDPKLALAPIGPVEDLDFDEPEGLLRHFAKPPAPRGG